MGFEDGRRYRGLCRVLFFMCIFLDRKSRER